MFHLPSPWRRFSLVRRLLRWTLPGHAGTMADVPQDTGTAPILLTMADLAELLGVTRQRVHQIMDEGAGPPVRYRCRYRGSWMLLFDPEDVDDWLERRTTGA